MATKVFLLINSKNKKVHIQNIGLGALCGAVESYKLYDKMAFGPGWSPAKRPNWCTKCIAKMVADLAKRNGAGILRPLMDYVLNMPAKKKEKKEGVIDSVRTELTFDDEGMIIKVLTGKSTGARGNFAVKVGMELVLDWNKLNEIRELTEEMEEVKLTIFKAREPNKSLDNEDPEGN